MTFLATVYRKPYIHYSVNPVTCPTWDGRAPTLLRQRRTRPSPPLAGKSAWHSSNGV